MKYDFDQLPNRLATESLKWHAYDPDVLPMWVADMDFLSPQPVIEALQKRVAHGVFGYPMEPASLRSLFVERLEHLYHWQVRPEDLVFIPGVVTGFDMACYACASPNEGLLIETPVYPPIVKAGQTTGRISQEVRLLAQEDGSYQVDFDAFEAAIDDRTRLFILCNPHNPVGRVFRREELERMAEICLCHGVTICSDEIHCDLVFNGHQHIPIASLDADIARNTITLMAPSKTYNLAGLECSIAIIPNPDLRKKFQAARLGLAGFVNLLGMTAAEAAYSQGQEWLEQVLAYLQSNRDFLYQYVEEEIPCLRMAKPEGTYLAWLDCRQTGIPGNPAQFFLEKGRVALNDGAPFGPGGAGFVRLNFGCPRSMLAEALERMKRALV